MSADEQGAGVTRRQAIKQGVLYGATLMAASSRDLFGQDGNPVPVGGDPVPAREVTVRFILNGKPTEVRVDARTSLLDLLRERLDLPGTKKGCDHGQCGACTLLIDGRRVLSCLTLAASLEGKSVKTIEGLEEGGQLHPVQAAFLEHDGFQCGYCTPGQIMSAVGFIQEPWPDGPDAVREGMSGNLCRCGAYCGIVAAVQAARRNHPS